MHPKEAKLRDILQSYESMAIAWSGGVDSTFLAAFAHEVLDGRVLMMNARSPSFAPEEAAFVDRFAKARGIDLRVVETAELGIDDYKNNPPNRCYFCKSEMYASLKRIATDAGMKVLADGANVEDFQDFRPGHQAAAEWDVRHPLKEAGMNKEDIRRFSKEMDLPTWDKPAFACLASRFPYGEALDETKLRRVADAESVLKEMGFRVFRVRSHGDLARIELAEEEMNRAYDAREEINTRMKNVGFTWVSMDLAGFRSGSMNESLSTQAVKRTENNKG